MYHAKLKLYLTYRVSDNPEGIWDTLFVTIIIHCDRINGATGCSENIARLFA